MDHKHKVVYCPVQKAGCSTWKTILANITSSGKVKPNMTLGQLRGFHATIQRYGLRKVKYTDDLAHYTKLLIVRHPMDRLVSAYWDKMRGTDKTFNKYAYNVVAKYRTNKTNSDPFPTFEEFVQMIFSKSGLSYNQHWDRFFMKSNPCYIHYDYILKLETMAKDMEMFLSEVYHISQVNSDIKLNSASTLTDTDKNTYSKKLGIYGELPQELVQKLLSYFKYEHQFFGYSFNEKTFETSCCHPSKTASSENCCC